MSSASGSSNSPVISVVIPFFNPGAYFLPALQSVFAQTFSDWELLLISDGGNDGSLQFASGLADPRVKVISDGANRGLSYRLNQGAELARGQYLFRMDADDIMHPERLSLQLEVLQSSSKNTVVGSACYSINQNSQVIGWRPATSGQRTGFAARHSFVHPTVAAATTWFRSNPYSLDFLYRRAEDAELWCRTASHTEFKWIDQPLLFYREVGVFSIGNYLAGQEAVLDLIRKSEHGPLHRLLLSSKERVKMGVYCCLSAINCDDMIVRHRYQRLPSQTLDEAEQIILHIMQTPLPAY